MIQFIVTDCCKTLEKSLSAIDSATFGKKDIPFHFLVVEIIKQRNNRDFASKFVLDTSISFQYLAVDVNKFPGIMVVVILYFDIIVNIGLLITEQHIDVVVIINRRLRPACFNSFDFLQQ